MEELFPQIVINYLLSFRQAFSQTGFPYFCGIVVGLLLQESRKTTAKLARNCLFLEKSPSSWERFFSQAQWSLPMVIDQLIKLVQEQLSEKLGYGQKLVVAIDTTYTTKVKGRMVGVQKWSHGKESVIGHHWAIAGLLARLGNNWRCLPVISTLLSGNKERFRWTVDAKGGVSPTDFWQSIVSMVDSLGRSLDTTRLIVVADAYFSKAPFLNPLIEKGVGLISRLRSDAVGFEDPVYSGRGRPPLRGKRWKLASLVRLLPLCEVSAVVYGQPQLFQCVVRNLWLRDVQRKVRVVAIWAKSRPILLVSTDLDLTAKQILEIYGARFSIELAIRDLKQSVGFSDYQMTSTLGIVRFAQLCCCALSVGLLMLSKSHTLSWVNRESDSWSFSSLRRSLKRFVIRRLIFTKSAPQADLEKYNELSKAVSQIAA